ncbi:MAG: hypothetical protein JWR09_1148 [Mucilaginibacter sp.]|nr:hypothetical protein [Mucilaginibacter sp.]
MLCFSGVSRRGGLRLLSPVQASRLNLNIGQRPADVTKLSLVEFRH